MLGMFREFRDFLLRGNLVELAVALVIGTAFAKLVSTFTSGLITPLITALGNAPDFSALSFTINESKFRYGAFLNALVSLAITASVVSSSWSSRSTRLPPAARLDRRRGERRGSARVHQRDPGAGAALRILHRGDRAGGRAGS